MQNSSQTGLHQAVLVFQIISYCTSFLIFISGAVLRERKSIIVAEFIKPLCWSGRAQKEAPHGAVLSNTPCSVHGVTTGSDQSSLN